MSVLYTNISENAERVIDPISQQVIFSLMRKLGVQEFFKDNTHFQNDRSADSLYDRPDGTLNLTANNRLDVIVDTHFNPDDGQLFEGMSNFNNSPAVGLTNRSKSNKREIFKDEKIKFSVRELNMPFTISFEISMRFREYDGAVKALSSILNRSKSGLINEVHDIVYSYPFDVTAWSVITEVFKRRTTYKKNNPNATVLDWLDTISRAQWGFDIRRPDLTETAVAKGDTEYAVTRQQLSCSAKLECSDGKPEPILAEAAPVGYKISCNYTVQLGRPHLLEFDIPPVVEQQELPAVFFTNSYETDDPLASGETSDPTMNQIAWYSANSANVRSCFSKLPEYDDWFTPYNSILRRSSFIPLIEAVVALDEVGKPTSVNLTELPDTSIAPFVLEILSSMDKGDILSYEGLFNITIFADDYPLDSEFIDWDKENKIISFTGDKPETVYRLVLAEAGSLKYIDKKWKNTLIKYRQFLPAALMRTLGYLSQVGILWVIGDSAFVCFLEKLLATGKLSTLTEAMIKKGCNKNIRRCLSNVNTYMRFVCNTLYLDRRFTIFDLLLDTAKELGYLSNNDNFGRMLNVDGIYNYIFTEGGLPSGYNVPLRIFRESLSTAK